MLNIIIFIIIVFILIRWVLILIKLNKQELLVTAKGIFNDSKNDLITQIIRHLFMWR